MDIRINCGIGDLICMESHWSKEFCQSIDKIYCLPYHFILKPLLKACSATTHINLRPIPEEDHDEKAIEWIVTQRFLQFRRGVFEFHTSSFLQESVADISRFNLPDRFVVIQSQTTKNFSHIRKVRDMKEHEWCTLTRILEDKDVYGVVLNSNGGDPPPKHSLIVNLVGETRIAESIEILKRAEGYMGIDSWLSCLAAQRFKANELLIRSPYSWIYTDTFADVYFKPHTDLSFIRKNFANERLLL